MRIAQHFVAGEVQTRPQDSHLTADPDDQQALDEFACDRSNLPWVIFRAAHRANHVAALPARARAVLAALARTVDAGRPFAAIFARRELLTGRALQSMRTFYRSLDDLETAGFITRPPQNRYVAAGLFGRAYLHLTSKASVLLGLTDAATANAEFDAPSPAECAGPNPSHSLAHPSVTVADGAIYKDLYPTNQKRQPGRLPADLQRLLSLGFREFLVFKLMREARLQGKRLSDVVEASWHHVKAAKHPINYLRALLRAPVDFAYRVNAQRTLDGQRESHDARVAEDANVTAEIAGQAFESTDGLRSFVVSDDGTTLTVHHRDEARPRVRIGAWVRDFIEARDHGRIVPSKPEARLTANVSVGTSRNLDVARDRLSTLKEMLQIKSTGGAAAIDTSQKTFSDSDVASRRPASDWAETLARFTQPRA